MRSLLVACLVVASLVAVRAQMPHVPRVLPKDASGSTESEAKGRLRILRTWSLSGNQRARADRLFREWTTAVDAHVPGEIDSSAVEISRWSGDDLDLLLKQTLSVLEAGEGARIERHLPPLKRVVALAARGAILHADVALLVPADPSRSATTLRSSPVKYYIINSYDGQDIGGMRAVVHLEVGRALLSFLSYKKLNDAAYDRLWYAATSAALLSSKQLGYAEPHVRAGLDELPDDPRLLFYSGALHEAFAASRIQRALAVSKMPFGFSPSVDAPRDELERAEKFFARAVRADPANGEVRVHHGRVKALLGEHTAAAAELAEVDGKLKDPQLGYYAALFHGDEEAAIGNRDAARAAFERAAALFPEAQSPLVALSRLARRHGDRAGATGALRRLFQLPVEENQRFDPWWMYYESHVRDAETLIAALYRTLTTGGTP